MTKKFCVIGNPINHSLSPKIQNYWFKQNKIESIYEKRLLQESELDKFIKSIKDEDISGVNVTVPFKQKIIPYLDKISDLSKRTQSVNTIYKKNNLLIGDNTDVYGFVQSIKAHGINLENKDALILGGGGVVPSIISALEILSIRKIFLKNRTFDKIKELKKRYPSVELIDWGNMVNFDIVINATSVGLKKDDKIDLNFDNLEGNKIFYDTIYNPPMTDFLMKADQKGHVFVNGKLMLVYQAQKAFEIWNNFLPEINDDFLNFLKDD